MTKHIPVLLNETIEGLNVKPNGIYVDLTLGRGGHSKEILKRLKNGRLISFDKDETAIEESKQNLAEFSEKFTGIHHSICLSDYVSPREATRKNQ